MAPLLLQVPITLTGGKPQIGQATVIMETPQMLQNLASNQVSAAKSRLSILKRKLRAAQLQYKRDQTPASFKRVEAIKAEIKRLEKIISAGQAKLEMSYKRTIEDIRRKIKSLRRRLKVAVAGERKVVLTRLDALILRYYNIRINRVKQVIQKNRSNVGAIRRRITKHRDIIIAIKAQEKRQTIPDPAMKVRRVKEGMKLKKARMDLAKADVRYKHLKKLLESLKAKKNRFLTKRMLSKVVTGQVSGSIAYLRRILMRHDRILKKCCRKPARRTRCGNLGLAERRLKKAIDAHKENKRINKQRPTPKTRLRLRTSRMRVAALRARVKQIRKCKGIILCGNLKNTYRLLERAKVDYARVMKVARNRPSDEESQKVRHKYSNLVKKYRLRVKKIWKCICNRAKINYVKNKRMFSKTGKKIYKNRMIRHKEMIRTCNCRAAKINFSRARSQFIKFRNRHQANTMDQNSKDKMEFYYKKLMQHYERLKLYKCKLPELPRTIQGGVKVRRRVKVYRRRR